jgi:hypothetical protein
MRRLLRLEVGVVLFLAAGAGAQTTPAPSEVLNRSYLTSCGRDKPATVKLKDGKFGHYLLMADGGTVAELIVLGAGKVKVAGDRRQHYAVFAKCQLWSTGGYELFLLRRSGRNLVQTASVVAPAVAGLYGVKQILQSDDLITVAVDFLRSSRSTVVERYEFKFRLTGVKLELVGHRQAASESAVAP